MIFFLRTTSEMKKRILINLENRIYNIKLKRYYKMIIFNHYILIFCYNRDVHWRASLDMLGAGLLRLSFQS